MNLLTALHTIVSRLRSRRVQTHGGAQAAGSDSETDQLTIEEDPEEWHPEDLLAGSGASKSIAPDDREGPAPRALPEAVEHDGKIILVGGNQTDWIRADPDSVIDWRELA